MIKKLPLIPLICSFLIGCSDADIKSVINNHIIPPQAWTITTAEAILDRSALDPSARINATNFDIASFFMVARIDGENEVAFHSNKIPPTEHSQLISGANFGKVQIKKTGVDAGRFSVIGLSRLKTRALPNPSRTQHKPTSIVCFENKNELRKSVPVIQVNRGDLVYFGHMEITLKLLPLENASGIYPALVSKIRHRNAPSNLDSVLREKGLDPNRVKKTLNAARGCQYGNLSLRSHR